MAGRDRAAQAALLERDFQNIIGAGIGHQYGEFTLVDVGNFSGRPKAITVRDGSGNLFVHFNGTGPDMWGYNAVAYGGPPSQLQNWAVSFFDNTLIHHSGGNLFVTGHSQGGNNAKFVTMRSANGGQITGCIAMDAPGFSNQFVSDTMNRFGQNHFDRQSNLIWGFNGDSDYVGPLGQQSIIPQNQNVFLETVMHLSSGNNGAFYYFHSISGRLDGDNLTMYAVNGQTAIRELVEAVNSKIIQLPPEQQIRAAETLMTIIESTIGNSTATIDLADFENLKTVLIPVVVDVFAENPEQITAVLTALGLDDSVITMAEGVLKDFNNLSPETREQILLTLSNIFTVENGRMVMDIDWFNFSNSDIFHSLIALLPALENIADNQVDEFLRNKGVPEFVIFLATPLTRFGVRAVSVYLRLFAVGVIVVNAIRNAWNNFRNRHGRNYAANNPFIRVNTESLRGYSSRISNVNGRISSLDSALRGLYWKVGLLDLWDIMVANILIRESSTLNQVSSYLNNAADRFDTAESRARGHMGG